MKKALLVLLVLFTTAFGCIQPEVQSTPEPSAQPSFVLPTAEPTVIPSPAPEVTPRATPISKDLIPEDYDVQELFDAEVCGFDNATNQSTCVEEEYVCKQDFNYLKQPDSCCPPDYCVWHGQCLGEYDYFLNNIDMYLYYCINGTWLPVEK